VRELLPQVAAFLRVGGREWRLPDALSALRHRAYRLFFIGQLVSLTGTWMQSTAQQWLVFRLTGSPMKLGTVLFAATLPVLLFSLPAGVIVDRVDKRRFLTILQAVQMMLALVLAVLVMTHRVTFGHIVALAALLGLANTFDMPTRQAFTYEMVGRDDLRNAIALNSSIFNGARLFGPALAGLLVKAYGEGPAILMNAVSFLAVIAALLAMRLPPRPATVERKHPWHEMKEGLAYIAHDRDVLGLGLMATIAAVFGFSCTTLIPVMAKDYLGLDAGGFGILVASMGLGALVGALSLAALGEATRPGLMTAARLAFALAALGFAASRSVPLSMLALAVAGWGIITNLALSNTLVQLALPDAMRGRVMAAYVWAVVGSAPLGSMYMGATAERWGAPAAIAGGAAFCLLAALLAPMVGRLARTYGRRTRSSR
jgi:predicted MFS family arabinose efflux permease